MSFGWYSYFNTGQNLFFSWSQVTGQLPCRPFNQGSEGYCHTWPASCACSFTSTFKSGTHQCTDYCFFLLFAEIGVISVLPFTRFALLLLKLITSVPLQFIPFSLFERKVVMVEPRGVHPEGVRRGMAVEGHWSIYQCLARVVLGTSLEQHDVTTKTTKLVISH